jgi:hypothetical protein
MNHDYRQKRIDEIVSLESETTNGSKRNGPLSNIKKSNTRRRVGHSTPYICSLFVDLSQKGGITMEKQKLNRALQYIADGVETGYSSVITFAYKEFLNASERQELASYLRSLTYTQDTEQDQLTTVRHPIDFD